MYAFKNADGDNVTEPAHKCQLLAGNFGATSRHDEGTEPPTLYREAVLMDALSITFENVLEILTKLDPHKVHEPDDIHPLCAPYTRRVTKLTR